MTFVTLIISVVSAEGIGRAIKCRVAGHRGYLSFPRGSLGTPRNLGSPLGWVVEGRAGDWGQSLGCPSQAEPTGMYFPWWTDTYVNDHLGESIACHGQGWEVGCWSSMQSSSPSLTTLNSFMAWWWMSCMNPPRKCWLWSWLFSGKLALDAFCGVISTECCQRAALCPHCLALTCFLQY